MQRVLVLGTGGTIAGRATSDSSGGYRSGEVGVDQLVAGAGLPARITTEQIANIGSQDMDFDVWRALHDRISRAFGKGEADAIVITHGTDTLEETGFFLDLTLPTGRPVVLVSAMRPADAIGSDGLRNLACGVRVAVEAGSQRRGVLAVLGDSVFSAASVYKATTFGTEAFQSFPRGYEASVTPSSLRYLSEPFDAPWRGRHAVPEHMPPVAILHAHASMDLHVVRAILGSGVAGVVLAGVGHGNAPAPVLTALADTGLPVVRSSRIDRAFVSRNTEVDDDQMGFIAGGPLNPAKCRILLQLLLSEQSKHLQETFDRF